MNEMISKLSAPFFPEDLGVRPASKAPLANGQMPCFVYVQTAAVIKRLNDVLEETWGDQYKVLRGDDKGVIVECKITALGQLRTDVGEGRDEKGAFSDALKRCAAKFGVGLYIKNLPSFLMPYDAQRKRVIGFPLLNLNDLPEECHPIDTGIYNELKALISSGLEKANTKLEFVAMELIKSLYGDERALHEIEKRDHKKALQWINSWLGKVARGEPMNPPPPQKPPTQSPQQQKPQQPAQQPAQGRPSAQGQQQRPAQGPPKTGDELFRRIRAYNEQLMRQGKVAHEQLANYADDWANQQGLPVELRDWSEHDCLGVYQAVMDYVKGLPNK